MLHLMIGINTPTESLFVTGGPLPPARVVTRTVHATISDVSNQHSHLMMNFGQFLDHDVTLSPEAGGEGGVEGER